MRMDEIESGALAPAARKFMDSAKASGLSEHEALPVLLAFWEGYRAGREGCGNAPPIPLELPPVVLGPGGHFVRGYTPGAPRRTALLSVCLGAAGVAALAAGAVTGSLAIELPSLAAVLVAVVVWMLA